ncbi:hypothetical protein AGMMS4952_20340 [Spirochaetia bacterium]|nr:hypothetical protein AGMMS4952_20340 [Spirochaetia bacterium]
MTLAEKKTEFEKSRKTSETVLLSFRGVDGFDVYNCSVPFMWEGQRFMYGRVEKRGEWARSWVRLFRESGKDEFTLVNGSMIYQLEDPFVSKIGKEIVMGGTHVRYSRNKLDTYYGYFYRGENLEDMRYFTTGPDEMKDIRLLELPQGIGILTRPRSREIEERYGSLSMIGFAIISNLDELDAEVIANARLIPDLFGRGEWGGCNQCYLLDSGYIGIIGHKSYQKPASDGSVLVYVNVAFVFDSAANRILDEKILATRSCYPPAPAKTPALVDCTFSSGIVMRNDGKADLYSGLGDIAEGRMVIDYPFAGYGQIVQRG